MRLLWTVCYRFCGFLWCRLFHLLSIPFWKWPVKPLSSVLWIWIFSKSWVWKCKGPFAVRNLVGFGQFQAAVLVLLDIWRRIDVKCFSNCLETFFYLDLGRQRIGDCQAPVGCQCRGPWISTCWPSSYFWHWWQVQSCIHSFLSYYFRLEFAPFSVTLLYHVGEEPLNIIYDFSSLICF